MDSIDILGTVFFITIMACAIFYNIVISRQKKRIAELEDENRDLHWKNERLRIEYEDLYECYMASLAREAMRDG